MAKYRDQTIIPRIKIQMALIGVVEIGLFKDKGHAQNPLPKIQGNLSPSSGQSDMMQALGRYGSGKR